MIYVGLDLSLHSTGYAIANTDTATVNVGRICGYDYAVSNARNKYKRMHEDAYAIAEAIIHKLMPYRNMQVTVVIEEVAFGYAFRPGSTNSVYQLLFEGSTVAALLKLALNYNIEFVAASIHKKAFTCKGNAKKEQSIARMLELYPTLFQSANKLDDIADALSIVSTKIDLSAYALNDN